MWDADVLFQVLHGIVPNKRRNDLVVLILEMKKLRAVFFVHFISLFILEVYRARAIYNQKIGKVILSILRSENQKKKSTV